MSSVFFCPSCADLLEVLGHERAEGDDCRKWWGCRWRGFAADLVAEVLPKRIASSREAAWTSSLATEFPAALRNVQREMSYVLLRVIAETGNAPFMLGSPTRLPRSIGRRRSLLVSERVLAVAEGLEPPTTGLTIRSVRWRLRPTGPVHRRSATSSTIR
jgi:hypothetical protein